MRTRVGYAGGTTADPTYRRIGDHSESIQIDFDPDLITYDELLKVFWESHSPTSQPWSRQYMSLILYHTEAQKRAALQTKTRAEQDHGKTFVTEITPLPTFYRAEAYHQKYRLRQNKAVLNVLQDIYPDERMLMNSTLAARVNGYLAGYGTWENLREEFEALDLPDATIARLRELL